MTALLAGGGLAFDYTGESVLTISSANWGLIGLIAFVVFILLTIAREVDLSLQQGPKIEVSEKKENDIFYLEVKNNGVAAEFEAQIQITEDKTGDKKDTLYLGSWQIGANSTTIIRNIDRIKIAHLETVVYPPNHEPLFPFIMSLYLYYYDKSSNRQLSWTSSTWTDRIDAIKPEYILRITISSTPSLKEGKFVRDYKLDFTGLTEI